MGGGMMCPPYRSGDREEAVVADEDNVEDGGWTQQVVHDQPELTQSPAQHPLASQDVGDVHRDAESPCREPGGGEG